MASFQVTVRVHKPLCAMGEMRWMAPADAQHDGDVEYLVRDGEKVEKTFYGYYRCCEGQSLEDALRTTRAVVEQWAEDNSATLKFL